MLSGPGCGWPGPGLRAWLPSGNAPNTPFVNNEGLLLEVLVRNNSIAEVKDFCKPPSWN